MHPLTRLVYKSIPLLEFEQFRHTEDRERLNEIRELAVEQVRDDLSSETGGENYLRAGRRSVVSRPGVIRGDTSTREVWSERSERERALEAGLGPVLDAALIPEQRVIVRMIYDASMLHSEVGYRLGGISKQAVQQRLAVIHKRVEAALRERFMKKEEEADGTRTA